MRCQAGILLTLFTFFLVIAASSEAEALTFPVTGYRIICEDGPDAGIDPDRDITTIGYQQDGSNAYFKFTVVNGTDWGVSFANERFFIYMDLDEDGHSDYLLFTENPSKTKLHKWDTSIGEWVDTGSSTADHLDPDADPDDHVYLGVALADLGVTDGMVIGASAATSNFKPTQREPGDESGLNDTTDSGNVGYGVLEASPSPAAAYSDTVTATVTIYDTSISHVDLKWYDPAGAMVRDSGTIAVSGDTVIDAHGGFTVSDTGTWRVISGYYNTSDTLLDTDTVTFEVVYDCPDNDGDSYGSGASCLGEDCDDTDPDNWTSCSTCTDSDGDSWFAGCDAYITRNGPDCDDGTSVVYPGAPELCDGIDNQCPGDAGYGTVDEGCGPVDTDGDGISDDDEINIYFTDPENPDTEGDGLGDYLEAVTVSCLDPLYEDSDNDSILDGAEDLNANGIVDSGETDPCSADSDGDGLDDGTEEGSCTSAVHWDSDGDGLPDGFEQNNLASSPALAPCDGADGDLDFDSDQNPNVHEYWNGTDLWTADPEGHHGSPQVGCAYWGEGDGDCVIGSGDLSNLKARISEVSTDYSNVIPPQFDPQDLDRDGVPGSGDLSILKGMISQVELTTINSRAKELVVLSQPSGPVKVGDTCHVTLGVLSEHPDGNKYTAGFAVVFLTGDSSTGSATLWGGDGEYSGDRYDFSGPVINNAPARITLRIDSAGTVEIEPFIPECRSSALPFVGRYTPAVRSSSPIEIQAVE